MADRIGAGPGSGLPGRRVRGSAGERPAGSAGERPAGSAGERPAGGGGWAESSGWAGSQAGREGEGLRGDGLADVELDDRVRGELDRAWVAGERFAVEEGRHVPRGPAYLGAAQWLSPHVEELPEGVDTLDRGFDVDDTGRVVSMQPVQAFAAFDEAVDDLLWPGNPDPGRDHLADAGGVDRQVSVDVIDGLLIGLARDTVYGGSRGRAADRLGHRPPTREGDHGQHHERDGRQHRHRQQGAQPVLPRPLLPADLGQLLLRVARTTGTL